MHSKFHFILSQQTKYPENFTKKLFRGETFDENVIRSMNSQRIINELLAQGQDAMTPEIQERMIDIITG